MGSFITIMKAVFSLIPIVIQGIDALEAAIPAGGQGSAKLDLLKNTLQSGYTTLQGAEAPFGAVWDALQPMIAGYVALMKANKPA